MIAICILLSMAFILIGVLFRLLYLHNQVETENSKDINDRLERLKNVTKTINQSTLDRFRTIEQDTKELKDRVNSLEESLELKEQEVRDVFFTHRNRFKELEARLESIENIDKLAKELKAKTEEVSKEHKQLEELNEFWKTYYPSRGRVIKESEEYVLHTSNSKGALNLPLGPDPEQALANLMFLVNGANLNA